MANKKDTTDWNAVDKLTDENIAAAVAADPDAAPLNAQGLTPIKKRGPQKKTTKVPTSIRLPEDVLVFFKSQGKGWQSKVGDVLSEYVDKHKV